MDILFNERFALANNGEAVSKGGMADVFRAYDLEENQVVAIKLFKENLNFDPVQKEAYEREQKSLFELNVHPNVVSLISTGMDKTTNRHYLVLEWVDNDLGAYTRKYPVESWEEFFNVYGTTILDALKFSYSRDILHRDITPKNILVT